MYVLNVNDLVVFFGIFHQMIVIRCIICHVIFSDFILRTTLEISVPRRALMCYP